MLSDSLSSGSGRIHSIDILRGLNILVMLFVNDLAGVAGAPAWMKHISPSTADGYTFVDVVFPAFLFIVGLSLPIALGRRLDRGESMGKIFTHIFTRTLSLLVLGVLMVNTESMATAMQIDPQLWKALLYASAVMVWISSGRGRRSLVWTRRALGVAVLLFLAFTYRSETGMGLRPQWWGILGLIGWAYLVAASIYLAARRHVAVYAAATAGLYLLYFADATGLLAFLGPVRQWIGIGSVLGSHAALTASGALLSMLLFTTNKTHGQRLRIIVLFAFIAGAIGVLLHSFHGFHPVFIYNKNAATPPWCLVSSAWTALIFALVYLLADKHGILKGTRTIAAAGQNALFAFILGPIAAILIRLLPPLANGMNPYYWLGSTFQTGFWRSLLFAIVGTWITAQLQRSGRYLKI